MKIACCGIDCENCEHYPNECVGCDEVKGVAPWLEYVEAEVCPIYDCCRYKFGDRHCGGCSQLPCNKYFLCIDPRMSVEQHFALVDKQVANLKILNENDEDERLKEQAEIEALESKKQAVKEQKKRERGKREDENSDMAKPNKKKTDNKSDKKDDKDKK